MSGAAISEVAYGPEADARQAPLPLASDGVQCLVWHMRYCDILIEIRDGVTWVNGARVEPAADEVRHEPSNEHKRTL